MLGIGRSVYHALPIYILHSLHVCSRLFKVHTITPSIVDSSV